MEHGMDPELLDFLSAQEVEVGGQSEEAQSGLEDRPYKLENWGTLVGKSWWMITFNLAQGYNHVSMASAAVR